MICHNYKQDSKNIDTCVHCGYPKEQHRMYPNTDIPVPEELYNTIFSSLDCKDDLTKDFIKQTLKNIRLFDKKQQDYGPRNISSFGEFGVLVRSNDKIDRLKTLKEKEEHPMFIIDPAIVGNLSSEEVRKKWEEENKPGSLSVRTKKEFKEGPGIRKIESSIENESINDTWQDLSIYATIALMLRKGKWPL